MFVTHRPSAQRAGVFLYHTSSGLTLVTPTRHRHTIFKPIGFHMPGLNPHDNHNWYHKLPDVIRSAGTLRCITFLNQPHERDTDDPEPTPYDLLRQRALALSYHTYPEWQYLFFRDESRRMAMPDPGPVWIMHAWVYAVAGRDLRRCPITNALIVLSPGAIRTMGLLLHDDEAAGLLFDPATTRVLDIHSVVHGSKPAAGCCRRSR